MERYLRIPLLVILFLSSFAFTFVHAEGEIDINYFTTDACISCIEANSYIDKVLEKYKNSDLNLIKHDILDSENEKLLVQYNNAFKVDTSKYKTVPAIFINDSYLIGLEDIKDNLEEVIDKTMKSSNQNKIDTQGASDEVLVNLTTLGIFLAGLIDGINPCSIAMMLFFISFVVMAENKDIKVLLVGLSFAFGTFVAYLGIGVGLFNFISLFKNIQIIMKGFYFTLFLISVYLIYLNICDYVNIRKGKDERIKNQLSRESKNKIHSIIKKNNGNALYLTAFGTAFLISFLEFFCTGQIYLPVITYMIKNTESLSYIFLLMLYNVAFILPLLFITFLMHLGKEVIDISTILVTKLHLIKLLGAMFFILVAIYSLNQMLSLII